MKVSLHISKHFHLSETPISFLLLLLLDVFFPHLLLLELIQLLKQRFDFEQQLNLELLFLQPLELWLVLLLLPLRHFLLPVVLPLNLEPLFLQLLVLSLFL